MADPLPKFACVDTTNPYAWAMCDRCGFWYNREDLVFQYEWAGMQLYDTGVLLCITGNHCYDTPNEQLRTIILPPDPPPIINARVPNFDYEEQTVIIYQFATPNLIAEQVNSDLITLTAINPALWQITELLPAQKIDLTVANPPWGAGPQLIMCDQTGTEAFILQYPQITQIS